MTEKRNIYKISSVIVAVVLGAGFATGQELIVFFVRFGRNGFAGILISAMLFALSAWTVLGICHKKNISSYNEFMIYVFGKKLSFIMETAIAMFLFVLFTAMLSASGEIFRQVYGLPFFSGSAFIAVLCVVTLAFGLDGFVKANSILAPIMVAGAIMIGVFTFLKDSVPTFVQKDIFTQNSWIFSSVLYTSYNMLTAISVLCSLSTYVVNKRTPVLSGMTGGFFIALLAICMSLPLFTNFKTITGTEIPMLEITRMFGVLLEYVYILILFAAIYTTAMANFFAFSQWIKSNFNLNGNLVIIIIAFVALICSHAGFSNFVSVLYPLFGYIGLIELTFILLRFAMLSFPSRKNRNL